MNQCNFFARFNSYVNIMLTLTVNHDHVTTQNIINDLLNF